MRLLNQGEGGRGEYLEGMSGQGKVSSGSQGQGKGGEQPSMKGKSCILRVLSALSLTSGLLSEWMLNVILTQKSRK